MALLRYRASIYTFEGNPNRTITAINTGGGIVSSRTTGKVPCKIQVSASAITATGTSYPYRDLFYLWDFGDPNGTEIFANPGADGGLLNYNSGQKGPEASYMYRTAGTYTITLKMWGKNGSAYISETVTQEVTISAFTPAANKGLFLSSINGSDANNGLTSATPKLTIGAMNTLIGDSDNTCVNVERGSSFDGSTSFIVWNGASTSRSGFRGKTYGTGAKPIFNVSSGAASAFLMTNGGSSSPRAKDDVCISDWVFSNSGTSTAPAVVWVRGGHASATHTHIYFDNCEYLNNCDNADCNGIIMQGPISKFGDWNCTCYGLPNVINENMGYFCSGANWFSSVAGSVQGGNNPASPNLEHDMYPSVNGHVHIRGKTLLGGIARSYSINVNASSVSGSLEYVDYFLIADCNGSGADRFHDASEANNDPTKILYRNFVCERNNIHDMDSGATIFFYCMKEYTHRYNRVWGLPQGRYFCPSVTELGTILTSDFYRNYLYYEDGIGTDYLYAMSESNWTQPHYCGFNIIVDLRTAAKALGIRWAESFTVDSNQYWCPNDSDSKFLFDGATGKTFAEHQAAGFDLNGSIANPNWRDPANGDFRVAA